MSKKETIVYGGAFNPPTLAHVAILQACIDRAAEKAADVWVLPSGDRFDKTIPTPRDVRLAYIDAMLQDVDCGSVKTDIISTELDRPIEVETYDTVRELEQAYPDRAFTFVFGADSTQTMAEWKQGQTLLDDLSMLVVEREGSEINPAAQHAERLAVVTPNVSSTEVRERMATGRPLRHLVSPAVAALLQ